jgi:Ca2+-transporting ATPase
MSDCGLAMGIQGTEVAKEAADMIITDDSFSTIFTGIREGRGLFMKIRNVIYFFICISLMEAAILFTSSINPDPKYAMFDYWQLNILYVTAHMFPSLGFTFGNNSKYIMQEKPRDSAEIITKPILGIMIIQMILIGFSIVFAYYICYLGVLPVSDFNHLGIVTYQDSAFADVTISAAQSKARTMALMTLFVSESFFMPIQIRRLNQSFKDSMKDMSYKTEFGFYLTSIIALIILIYVVPLQNFMADVIHWPINFMYLDGWDWLIIVGLALPNFIGFELLRAHARKKKIFF